MQRVAIILDGDLPSGRAANVAAIVMGQAACRAPEMYADAPVKDKSGVCHASIRQNVIILQATRNQLASLVAKVRDNHSDLLCVVFSEIGQELHDAFAEYQVRLNGLCTSETRPIGLLLFGDAEAVRTLTRKFSLFRPPGTPGTAT